MRRLALGLRAGDRWKLCLPPTRVTLLPPSPPSSSVFSKRLARLRHLCLRTSRPDVTPRTTCGPSDQSFGSLQNKRSCPNGAPCRSRYVPRIGIRCGSAAVTHNDDTQEEDISYAGGHKTGDLKQHASRLSSCTGHTPVTFLLPGNRNSALWGAT